MSDLTGRVTRANTGFRARWELAENLQRSPYEERGRETGTLCAYFHNVVRLNGIVVTDVLARVPNMVALTEQQLRENDDRIPTGLPDTLKEQALQKFADHRASHKPVLVSDSEERPRQMAAQQQSSLTMEG